MNPAILTTPRSAIKVWIVEDSDSYRQDLTYLLSEVFDFECVGVYESCEAALQAVVDDEKWEIPDVILLDIEIDLPGEKNHMSGIEGISHLKSFFPTAAVIMLTVHDAASTIFDAMSNGASGYLLKSTTIDDLAEAIQAAHRGGMLMPPPVARKVRNFFIQSKPRTDHSLTDRELEILTLMSEGKSQPGIAEALCLSRHTIDSHMRNIYQKLHVHSGLEAITVALRDKILQAKGEHPRLNR